MRAVFVLVLLASPAASEPIRSIDIDNANVFDPRSPGEDIWPFRVANAIHIVTKPRIIKRELTFKEGDEWDPFSALESERLLRSYGSFRYVEISSSASGVKVRTQDAWTLNTRFSFGTEGGEDVLTYGVEERNLLGLNKQVGLLHHRKGPKKRDDLRYTDPRLLGTRLRAATLFARTNKGDSYGGDLSQPFYSLDTPHAVSAGYNRFIEEKIIYRDAEEHTRWVEREQAAQFALGGRLVADRTFVQRVESGWYASKRRFHPTADTRGGALPAYRELSGPTAGYSWVQPQYVKETYVDSMEFVEDFNMGNELRAVAGFMGTAFGSDRDRWVFNVSDQQGYRLSPGRFALAQAGLSGRSAGGQWDNALFYANLNLFWRTGWPGNSIWVAHLEGNKGRRLDMGNQVALGGDTGLRGYRNNSFTGGQSALLNLENRFFFPGELFHLLRAGGVLFFDAGLVERLKTDVGLGLRFVPTRGRTGTAFRVDVARALQQGPGGKRWVVSITGGQAFQLFNSSTRRLKTTPASRLGEIAPPSFPELE